MAVLRQDTRQIYYLHQKGTSLSDKAVAPSQYDLNLVARSNANTTTTTSKGSSYTIHAFTWIFWLIVVIHSCCILFQFWNERSYLLRPTLEFIGIEGGSTAGVEGSIYFHSFSCPTWAGKWCQKISDSNSCEHTHLRNKLLIQENN